MAHEVEAKFQISSPQVFDQIRLQRRVGDYQLTDQRIVSQGDTYLDTASGFLFHNKATLRMREKAGGTYLATFKSKIDGNYVRREIETPLTSWQAEAFLSGNLAAIDIEAVQAARSYLNGEKIRPVLYIRNRREAWHIQSELGHITICFDNVLYTASEKKQYAQEYELELELTNGNETFLQKIVQILSQQHKLIRNSYSKYERGVTLLGVFALRASIPTIPTNGNLSHQPE
jgi:inorganic triphosphatase YgiF